MPRRFDIPGDTDGIAFRLADPEPFVGQPALVVGGGTSAAEAVIALSCAKAGAEDPTPVHWSYRGDRMPRVSKALAAAFFEAYVGNGNVRYHPRSEPVAVVRGEDHEDYLAIRIDRRVIDGRPNETTQLEFPKAQCIACIGEDVPLTLLASMGIEPVAGGARGKTRMVVNRWLETRRGNLFLAGDLLSQAYLEADDFDADPATFRDVRHRGNIKSALRDGVLIAQIMHQRLTGGSEADAPLEDAEDKSREGSLAVRLAELAPEEPAPPTATPAAREASAFLTRLLRGGVEEEACRLAANAFVTIGRADCDLEYRDDTFLAPRHASIRHSEAGFELRDEGGDSGTFLRLHPARKYELSPGDLLRVGRQYLLYEHRDGAEGAEHRLRQFDDQGREVAVHPVASGALVLGRAAPERPLAEDDRTLSRRHLALAVDADGALRAKDLKSANGSFLRVRGSIALAHGDRFRVGRQTFRLSEYEDASLTEEQHAPAPTPSPLPSRAAAPAAAALAAVATDGPAVTFVGRGTFPAAPGQTLCEIAENAGLAITAECHSGICGSDPIRIVEGKENLDGGPDDQECETLEELCDRDPAECRLACLARVKGPVTVEIL